MEGEGAGAASFAWGDRAPLSLFVAGLALVVAFDLGTPVPFNDEWLYRWVVQRFVDGHGFHLFPGQAPSALVQLGLGVLVSFRGTDPQVLRLSAVPFIAATGFALYKLSRDLGADRFFSGVAAAAPLAIPVYAAAVTGYMTEPYYLALLMLAALVMCRWLTTGRGAPMMLTLSLMAALQRQHAAALPPALTIGLLIASRRRTLPTAAWAWLGAVWLAVGAAVVLPPVMGLQTIQMQDYYRSLVRPALAPGVASLLYVPGMTGLACLAFAGGLVWREQVSASAWWRTARLPALIGLFVVLVAKTYVLPGNYLTMAGLNPITVAGNKPSLYAWVLPPLNGLCLLCFAALVVRPTRLWPIMRDPRAVFLVALGMLGLLPLLSGDVLDRYYLPVVLPLLPVVAALTRGARWPRASRLWAVAALLAGLVMFVVGEGDYQSWQVARAAAERMAVQRVPAAEVFSGFEPYGVDVVLPELDRTGRLPPYAGLRAATLEAPPHPRMLLVITGPYDPRPGASYRSLAPGKIVLVCVDRIGCPG